MRRFLEENYENSYARSPGEPHPESIQHRCGHFVGVAYYRGTDCQACRNAKRQEKAKQKREQREQQPKAPKPMLDDKGRLPDGAEFHSVYHGETETWNVVMVVAGRSFTATGSSIEKTMRDLAGKWRESQG